jgi:hypothetical protein
MPGPPPVERHIAGRLAPRQRASSAGGAPQIGYHLKLLAFDDYPFRRIARRGLVIGNDERNGFADVPDALSGERRTMGHDKPGTSRHRSVASDPLTAARMPVSSTRSPRLST